MGDLLNLELYIMDLIESNDIKTASQLEIFSDIIHQHVETAFMDYAEDCGIMDYGPQY